MAHIELYDDAFVDEDEDLFTFNNKNPATTAWERMTGEEESDDDQKQQDTHVRQHPPAVPRSVHSTAPTDDEDRLAPDTPSPFKGEEEEAAALEDLLDMAQEAEEEEDEEEEEIGGDEGGTLPSSSAEETGEGKQRKPATKKKLAWRAGGTSGDDTNVGSRVPISATASRNTTSNHNRKPAGAAAAQAPQQQQPQRPAVDRRRTAVAGNPTQLAVNDWMADAAVLRSKQSVIEARDPRLAPEIEVIAKHGAAAASSEQDDLRRELTLRLRRIRGGVTVLGHHVCNIRAGPDYVTELGLMMDGAEGDILALKDAQRTAFDALMREERELTRHVDEFAARVDVWDSDKSDPTWAAAEASTSAPAPGGAGAGGSTTTKRRPGSASRRPSSAVGASLEPWARAAASNSPKSSPSKLSLKMQPHAHANRPPPQAVQDYDDFMSIGEYKKKR